MKPFGTYLRGNVLPTVVVVSVVILTGMLGLCALWAQEAALFARTQRLRQARSDVESACLLYRLHPDDAALRGTEGFLLYDSLPQSRVFVVREPWGLYEAVKATSGDSLVCTCRLYGAEPDAKNTLFYAGGRPTVTLAGRTVLKGVLRLPQNGLVYGRVGGNFYRGPQIPHAAILHADECLPQPVPSVLRHVAALFRAPDDASTTLPDSLFRSFRGDSALVFNLGTAEINDCTLRGRILLCGEELRIDSTCRMEHVLVAAHKITVGRGTHISAQLFARDTVVIEPRAVLEYPSGVYAGRYAAVGNRAEVNGYVIVRDTVRRERVAANYLQSRTARVRGLVWVEGVAWVQGIVAGCAVLREAVCFTPQGYYEDTLYDMTLLVNPVTAQPLWLSSGRRKEAACVD